MTITEAARVDGAIFEEVAVASKVGSVFELAAGESGIPVGRTGLKLCAGFAPAEKSAHRIVQMMALQSHWRLIGSNLAAEFSGTQAIGCD
jgi:hypothetical protein